MEVAIHISEHDPSKEIQFMSALRTPQDEIQNRAGKGEHYLLDVDNPLVVPVNKRIRFLITSNDVIHSFWVPDFAVKKDAIPGFVHESWAIVEEPGIYRGQCGGVWEGSRVHANRGPRNGARRLR